MSENMKNDHTRREFVRVSAATALGTAITIGVGKPKPTFAAGSDEIRVGLIGCGGRGTGAAVQAIQAAPNVRLVAMADAFKDRLDDSLKRIKAQENVGDKVDVPPDRQFVGLDAYSKLIGISDINYVIIATPPGFKPDQIKAAIMANKHVFAEKPMAVDGPGIRTCLEMYEEAKKRNLAVGIGLQRRHHKSYLEVMKRVQGGAIGEITSARAFWLGGGLWMKPRQKEWTDLEWQMRNWLYFTWLSGDHIVEQHIHNIDVVSWAIGAQPISALAVGGRQQRVDPAYGHIFDHFAVDYEYPKDVHLLSMARQIPNCQGSVSEHLAGTKGRTNTNNKTIFEVISGKKTWTHDPAKNTDAYIQEHIDLITSIRKGKPLNELKWASESNLAAIMGRMSAYTGKRVTFEQALNSKEDLFPKPLAWGKLPVAPVAIPGTSDVI